MRLKTAKPTMPAPNITRLEGSGTLVHLPGSLALYAKTSPYEPCVDPSQPRVVSMLRADEQGAPHAPTNQETICPWFPVTKKILIPLERFNVWEPSDIEKAKSGSVAVGVPNPPYP